VTLAGGVRLGPYEILAPLGAGGMGEVYRARDTRLDRVVALKILPPAAAADGERLRRFEHEARAVAALNHPNICALHDVGCETPVPAAAASGAPTPPPAEVHFLVMEYLEGETLAERLRQRKGGGEPSPFPLDVALECGAQIADALARAHRQGIIHRDLKPANIMLLKTGARPGARHVKLLDFGLARLKAPAAAADAGSSDVATLTAATRPGTVFGTVPYMAPEQIEGRQADARTDLFAFGCVLFEMLTARRAFEGSSDSSVMSAILSHDPPPLSALQPLTPPALDRLVRRCLAKDPDARWQHASDVAEELRGISQDSASRPLAQATPSSRRPHWALASAATLLLLVAAAAAWYIAGRQAPRTNGPARFEVQMPGAVVFTCRATSCVAIAADGTGMVYQGSDGTRQQLYWADLAQSVGWPLQGTEGAENPFLSPDGRWLGFLRGSRLFKLPLQFGRVPDGSQATALTGEIGTVRGAAWGPDGTILFAVGTGELMRLPPGGGDAVPLTRPQREQNEMSHRWPSFLPGGRAALFTVWHASGRSDRSAIAVVSLDDGRWTRIIDDGGTFSRYLLSGHIVYGRRGSILAVPFDLRTLRVSGNPAAVANDVIVAAGTAGNYVYDVANDGTLAYARDSSPPDPPSRTVAWITRQGESEPLSPDRRFYDQARTAMSPDGRRLAIGINGDEYTDLWVYDLIDRRWQQVTTGSDCRYPVWSPDGRRLVFTSNRDGALNLYLTAVDEGRRAERLTESFSWQVPQSWSPDGRFVAFTQQETAARRNAHYNTWILPLDGDRKPWIWVAEGLQISQPAFSPDGRWVAYQSLESQQWEVWVRPFPGPGEKLRVSGKDGGYAPVWSPDGREILYIVRGGDTRVMGRRVEVGSGLRLGTTGVRFAIPFALPFAFDVYSRTFSLADGGRRLVTVQMETTSAPDVRALTVVPKWPEEIKAKLAAK